jgi:hypothetical protein
MSVVLVAEEIDETAYAAARFSTYWVFLPSKMSLHHPLCLEPSCDGPYRSKAGFDGAAAVNIVDVDVSAKWYMQRSTWVVGGENKRRESDRTGKMTIGKHAPILAK